MRKTLKVIAWAIGGLVVLVLAGSAYNNFAPLPTYAVEAPAISVVPDSSRIARGEHLVSLTCAHCHRGENSPQLVGHRWHEDDFGDLYTANITQHPTAAIAQYSDSELAFLLRTGIKKNGELAYIMPRYTQMSDDDIQSVIAFLRSDAPMVQGVEQNWPPRRPTFLAKMITRMAFKPEAYPATAIAGPETLDAISHGRYLVHNLSCFVCHSADFSALNEGQPELSENYLGGGALVQEKKTTNKVLAPNLTAHADGLGTWTEAEFAQMVRFGQRPADKGGPASEAMPRFSNLTDEEVGAIWAYLKSIPKLEGN